MSRTRRRQSPAALRSGAALVLPLLLLVTLGTQGAEGDLEFTDVERQTRQFHRYHASIELTPEQERIKNEALLRLPAPCCSDRTAATCCCPCNSAKAWWGLTKHLIAERGYDAAQVTEKVSEWFEFINPDGFSGDSCYSAGCGRSFAHNGCGGMNENQIVF